MSVVEEDCHEDPKAVSEHHVDDVIHHARRVAVTNLHDLRNKRSCWHREARLCNVFGNHSNLFERSLEVDLRAKGSRGNVCVNSSHVGQRRMHLHGVRDARLEIDDEPGFAGILLRNRKHCTSRVERSRTPTTRGQIQLAMEGSGLKSQH